MLHDAEHGLVSEPTGMAKEHFRVVASQLDKGRAMAIVALVAEELARGHVGEIRALLLRGLGNQVEEVLGNRELRKGRGQMSAHRRQPAREGHRRELSQPLRDKHTAAAVQDKKGKSRQLLAAGLHRLVTVNQTLVLILKEVGLLPEGVAGIGSDLVVHPLPSPQSQG